MKALKFLKEFKQFYAFDWEEIDEAIEELEAMQEENLRLYNKVEDLDWELSKLENIEGSRREWYQKGYSQAQKAISLCDDTCKHYHSDNGNYPLLCGECSRFYSDNWEEKK